jgi:hypothetical protein
MCLRRFLAGSWRARNKPVNGCRGHSRNFGGLGNLRRRSCAAARPRRIQGDVRRPPKREKGELLELLQEQRAALHASCEGFDRGDDWEAPRLATAIFTLVHDGGGIVSLLTQLGLRSSLRFLSSGRIVDKPNLIALSPPLLKMSGDQLRGVRFEPRPGDLAYNHRRIQFESWWGKETIYKRDASALTRKRLVFALRHQDGGGHVGTITDPVYLELKKGGGWFG